MNCRCFRCGQPARTVLVWEPLSDNDEYEPSVCDEHVPGVVKDLVTSERPIVEFRSWNTFHRRQTRQHFKRRSGTNVDLVVGAWEYSISE